jgi:hypothetical protein
MPITPNSFTYVSDDHHTVRTAKVTRALIEWLYKAGYDGKDIEKDMLDVINHEFRNEKRINAD